MRSLRVRDALQLGEEARDLARLVDAKVALAEGWVVRLGSDHPERRLLEIIEHALATGAGARLRPLFPTHGASQRFERRMPRIPDVRTVAEAEEVVKEVLATLAAPELRAALGGSLAGLRLRVLRCDAGSGGKAASADPVHGDPDELGVWTWERSSEAFRIDRRSGRVVHVGEGMTTAQAERVADLADRAQLALGRPLEIEWSALGRRIGVASVRSLSLHPTFTSGAFRRVALVAADEGTVAPLSVDALDRALSPGGERAVGHTVRRMYARPYRRLEGGGRLLGNVEVLPLPLASAAAVRAAADAVIPFAAVVRYERGLAPRLAEMDEHELRNLEDDQLVGALEARHGLVAEALQLLDRLRELTRTALAAMETVVGPLPRECYPALAAPVESRSRRRIYEAMAKLALKVEAEGVTIVPRKALSTPIRRRWDELRATLVDVRPLGIDVRPVAIGSSEESFMEALTLVPRRSRAELEKARKDALRRVASTARSRSGGRAREGLVLSTGALVKRTAKAKGVMAECLAAGLLRLRRAAVEAGRRLVERGVIDAPDDALYLTLAELAEALRGEPGAYTARVRLRREDDDRWAWFDAPRRIGAR